MLTLKDIVIDRNIGKGNILKIRYPTGLALMYIELNKEAIRKSAINDIKKMRKESKKLNNEMLNMVLFKGINITDNTVEKNYAKEEYIMAKFNITEEDLKN